MTDQPSTVPAVSDEELNRRLLSPDKSEDLAIVPLGASRVTGSAIDVRLGTRFVSMRRTATAAIDLIDSDPTGVARLLEERQLAFGESYNLHPGELILAATLEYIALPGDLAATVASRSSYGRVGLVIATAPYVHPHYRGCLTLELANLGSTPLILYAGLPVAQLSFMRANAAVFRPSRYNLATGPLFPTAASDDRAHLRQIKRSFQQRSRLVD